VFLMKLFGVRERVVSAIVRREVELDDDERFLNVKYVSQLSKNPIKPLTWI
jgi:hypothetical protein